VLRTVFLHLGLFVAFVVLSRLSTVFPMTELRSTPWNPETGLAVAAGLLLRGPAVLTTAAAIFVSTRLWGWPLPGAWEFASAALRSLVFVGSASLAAPLLLRSVSPTLQTVIVFFGFSALITALYAVVRLALLWLSVGIEPVYLLSYTATLSIGNLLGIVTLVPLFMIIDKNHGVGAYLKRWGLFQWASLAGLVIVSFVVFGIREVDEFKFFYLVFIPVIVFAVRDGYVAAALSVFLSDLLMIGVLYWRDFESSTATELQFLMLSLSATGLLLGTAISERARAVEELKQSHLRLQESQTALLQASRLSLASEMAAALAHELNQPLSSVRNFVRAVRRRLEFESFDREAAKSDIDAAVAQVDSAASLLRSTRSFLERGSVQRSPLELQPLVSRCRQLVQAELRQARISLSIHDMSPLPPVICNEVQIQQVLLNVIKNAKESIMASGDQNRRITIKGSASPRPGFVEISVEDTGPGVSPELKPLLFQPLQSSKPEGLGLGLSLCSTIIRSHGGEFWLDESFTKGARFVFTLPCVNEKEGPP
jgi:two-component system sensor kinase FixL